MQTEGIKMDEHGYCGLNCRTCPVRAADIAADDAMKAKAAAEWSILYKDYLSEEISPEEVFCDGCKAGTERIFKGCGTCEIRKCCAAKDLENCAYCGSFRECDMIQGFLFQEENMDARNFLEKIHKE